MVVALADGAGGTARGEVAAAAVVAAAAGAWGDDGAALLAELDREGKRLGGGQATAVVLAVAAGVITGASVGDSGAWLVRGDTIVDLTEHQIRKPLVGSGCVAGRIAPTPLGDGTLLVASDGLSRYASPRDVARVATGSDLDAAAHALVALVRLPTGALQDDVSVVLVRAVGDRA